MHKLLFVSLFVAFVCADTYSSAPVTGQTWDNYENNNCHVVIYHGDDNDFGTCTSCSKDMTEYMNNEYCYFIMYPELGCTQMPTAAVGIRPNLIFDFEALGYGRYVRLVTKDQLIALYQSNNNNDLMSLDPRGNVPYGCTDRYYNPHMDDFLDTFPNDISSHEYNSVLVVCPNTDTHHEELVAPMPRTCTRDEKMCGEYDAFGPCVGPCSQDNYYCNVDLDEYVCLPEMYGHFTYFASVKFPGGVELRVTEQNYEVPTFTNFENAFAQDISEWVDAIPPAAVYINDYEWYSHATRRLNLHYTVNVDTANNIYGTTHTLSNMQARMLELLDADYQDFDDLMDGPFTRYFDLNLVFETSNEEGTPYSTEDTEDEWFSVNIPESWDPQWVAPLSGAGSLTACATAVVVALLAHLW